VLSNGDRKQVCVIPANSERSFVDDSHTVPEMVEIVSDLCSSYINDVSVASEHFLVIDCLAHVYDVVLHFRAIHATHVLTVEVVIELLC
jgi:hypothetical protein